MDLNTSLFNNLASFHILLAENVIKPLQKRMKNTVKLVFYNHPQRCDNISHTVSEKTDHHHNTIFRNNKLSDNMENIREYFHFILFLRREVRLRSYFKNSCIGFHGGFQTIENNKSTRLATSYFHQFSRVWKPWWNPRTYFWNSTWKVFSSYDFFVYSVHFRLM